MPQCVKHEQVTTPNMPVNRLPARLTSGWPQNQSEWSACKHSQAVLPAALGTHMPEREWPLLLTSAQPAPTNCPAGSTSSTSAGANKAQLKEHLSGYQMHPATPQPTPTCVVFPDPVSPTMMTIWCSATACSSCSR